MNLTVTLTDQEAKRILDLAWSGVHQLRDDPLSTFYSVDEAAQIAKDSKKVLESFRSECESAKGGRL